MKPSDISDLVKTRLSVGSALINDEDIAKHLNYVLEVLAGYINDRNRDYFLQKKTLDLVSGQHLYSLGGVYKIRRVFANLKENVNDVDNIVELLPIHQPVEYSDEQVDEIENAFGRSRGDAFYEKRGDNIFLYTGSFVSVSAGLSVEYYGRFKTISVGQNGNFNVDLSVSDSTGFGVPDQFHAIIADAVSYFVKMSGDKVLPLTRSEEMWESLLQEKVFNINDDIQIDVPYRDIPIIQF